MSEVTKDLRALGFGPALDAVEGLEAKVTGLINGGGQITASDGAALLQAIQAATSGIADAAGKIAANPSGIATVAAGDVVSYLTQIITAAISTKFTGGIESLALSEVHSLAASLTTWITTELKAL